MIRTLSVLAAIAVFGLSRGASADEATAKARYDAGERAYNLGDFAKAIALFKEAYEQLPEPAFLFNVAQAYRQSGDCKQALFFYKRFLSLKENDTQKPIKPTLKEEVTGRVAELEECVRRDIASKPPTQLDDGQNGAVHATTSPKPASAEPAKPAPVATRDTTHEGGDDGEPDHGPVAATTPFHPKIISARITGGAANVHVGNLDAGFQPTGAFVAGYPLALGPIELDLGPAITFAPAPYTTTAATSGTADLIGLLANAGVRYAVIPKLAIRADVGGGVLVLTGFGKAGNPFTAPGATASGAVSTLLVRAAVSADYRLKTNLAIVATPFAFTYSPAPSGFQSTISSLTTLAFLLGVEYRQ